MSATAAVGELLDGSVDARLTADVLEHLEVQLQSARRLLDIVLRQGTAIRAREVHDVVALAGLMQAEMERRAVVERNRAELLTRAGARLEVDPGAVTIERLCAIMDPASAEVARERSGELRGLLQETGREHHTNRALMTQQLAFLDHLLGLAEIQQSIGYGAGGGARTAGARLTTAHRVLDLEV